MKAAVLTGYNKNGQDLELCELPVPEPDPGPHDGAVGAGATWTTASVRDRATVR